MSETNVSANPISKEHLLLNLHPFFAEDGKGLPDLNEPTEKLKASLTLILGCQDADTGKFTINDSTVTWALLAALDILAEVDSRTELFQVHVGNTWREMNRRLDQCYIMHREEALKTVPAVQGVQS